MAQKQPNPKFGTTFGGMPLSPIDHPGSARTTKPPVHAAPVSPRNRGPFGPSPTTKLVKSAGGTVINAPGRELYMNVRALQNQLRKDGYDLKVDGKLGPQTLSALADYYKGYNHMSPALKQAMEHTTLVGKRDPQAWNKQYGTTKTRLAPNLAPTTPSGKTNANTTLDANGNPQYPSGGPSAAPVNLDPAAKAAAAVSSAKMLPDSLAKFGSLIPAGTADAQAGLQFDPQIREAQLALARDPYLAKQHGADIGSWYGQVLGSEKTAAARDKTAGASGENSISGAAQALLASLGGGANMGAGDVGAAGADATGTLAALDTAQNQYNNDLAPILQNERASMLASQANKDAQQQQADQLAVENLQGQRGQAVVANQAQDTNANNALEQARAGMLLNVRNQNNALAQQGFQNSLALAQAQIAAEMNGLDAQYKAAQIAHTTALANRDTGGQTLLGMTPTERNKIMTGAVHVLQDPQGNWLNITPALATARVNTYLQSYLGYTPKPGTFAARMVQQVPISVWQQGLNGIGG